MAKSLDIVTESRQICMHINVYTVSRPEKS